MKTLFTLILTISLIALTNAQSFVKVNGQATDIAISPKDGSVYVVGTSKNVFKYHTATRKFKPFGKQSKNVKSITVHPNGTLYMASTSNEVYKDYNGYWNKITGIKTNELDIDKNGNIRALDASGKSYNLYNGQWQEKTLINKNTSGFNQIVGQDSKTLFARFKDNAFKTFKSGRWTTLNGNPLKITMDDKTGVVYAVGRNKGIYKWNKGSRKWVLLQGTRKDFKDVAAQNGKVWGVTTGKAIYVYDTNIKPSTTEPKDYSGTYKVTVTRILMNAPEYKINKSIDIYGTIGIHVESKTRSGNVKINAASNQRPRVWDVSKNNPKKPVFKFKNYQTYTYWVNGKSYQSRAVGETKINVSRTYKIIGEAANQALTFDIQTNISQKGIPLDINFKYENLKINVDEFVSGREYFIRKSESTPANNFALGFKIEKL